MIAQRLVETGLLQFGRFSTEEEKVENGYHWRPYALHLDMLPAYPDLMQEVSTRIIERLPIGQVDRLVATPDVVALGGVVSVKAGVSLVYSRGRGEHPKFDLVGAYDVGHPACLLTSVLEDLPAEELEGYQRVGLDIICIVPVLALRRNIAAHDLQISPVWTLRYLAEALEQQGHLPPGQADAVRHSLG